AGGVVAPGKKVSAPAGPVGWGASRDEVRTPLLFFLLPGRANNGGGSLRPGVCIFLGGLIGLPGLELLEQRVAIGLGSRAIGALRVLVHEVVELGARHRRDAVLV